MKKYIISLLLILYAQNTFSIKPSDIFPIKPSNIFYKPTDLQLAIQLITALLTKSDDPKVLLRVPQQIPLIGNAKIIDQRDLNMIINIIICNDILSKYNFITQDPDEDKITLNRYSFFHSSSPQKLSPDVVPLIVDSIKRYLIELPIEIIHTGAMNIAEDTTKRYQTEQISRASLLLKKAARSIASFVVRTIVGTARTARTSSQWQTPTVTLPKATFTFCIDSSLKFDFNLEFVDGTIPNAGMWPEEKEKEEDVNDGDSKERD